jgi:hypothetical protein
MKSRLPHFETPFLTMLSLSLILNFLLSVYCSNAMDEVEKAIAQVHAQRDQTLKEKAEIESEIETCIEAIGKFQVGSFHNMLLRNSFSF